MAFMKSVVQVTCAIKNIKDLEDFQFAQKTTLTAIIMVSRGGGLPGAWERGGLRLLTGFHLVRGCQSSRGHLRGKGVPFASVLL